MANGSLDIIWTGHKRRYETDNETVREKQTVGLRSDWENPVLKLRVNIDQERARRAGVTSDDIARALSATFDGQVVTSYREGEKVIPVTIRA